MRSEPVLWSLRVMTIRPPAAVTASPTPRLSVAPTPGPPSASWAGRMTRTIIGCPPMSASGLPGRRSEAMRAGIRMRTLAIKKGPPQSGVLHAVTGWSRTVYTGCQPGGKPAMCPRSRAPDWRRFRPPCLALRNQAAMDSFEINKILGAFLFTCLVLRALNIGAGAVYAPIKAAKPGMEVAVTEHPGGGEQAKAEPDEPIEKLLASASVDKGANAAKKCAACHTFG